MCSHTRKKGNHFLLRENARFYLQGKVSASLRSAQNYRPLDGMRPLTPQFCIKDVLKTGTLSGMKMSSYMAYRNYKK